MMVLPADLISRFPCCHGMNFQNLTMAQASVIELASNLSDDGLEFNLCQALRAWKKEDLTAFWQVVKEAYDRQLMEGAGFR